MDRSTPGLAALIETPRTRRQFFKGIGIGLATLAVTAVHPQSQGAAYAAEMMQGLSDLDILNFALTLEHLEAEFYIMAVDSGKLSGDALKILTAVRDHEVEHVTVLAATIKKLGGTPVEKAKSYAFGDMSTQEAILATSETLEGVGVGAYTGAAALIKDKTAVLPAAASIEQVEARHYAAIRALRGSDPTPEAFGPTKTVAEVTAAVEPIIGK